MAVSAWARVWKTERQTSSATRGRELAKAQPLPPCKPKVLTLRIRTDRGAASFYRGSLGDSATIFRGPVSDRDRARGQHGGRSCEGKSPAEAATGRGPCRNAARTLHDPRSAEEHSCSPENCANPGRPRDRRV